MEEAQQQYQPWQPQMFDILCQFQTLCFLGLNSTYLICTRHVVSYFTYSFEAVDIWAYMFDHFDHCKPVLQ